MKKSEGLAGNLIGLLMPLILVLGGAGLATAGLTQGSLLLIGAGIGVFLLGIAWAFVMLDLTNPFDWF